jgi:formylglycine-generating enzyme
VHLSAPPDDISEQETHETNNPILQESRYICHKTMHRIKFLFVLLAAVLLAASTAAQTRRDHAVFFPVTDYPENSVWVPLDQTLPECQAIAADLESIYGATTEVLPNYTKARIKAKLSELATKKYGPQDQLILFFSMHGYFDEAGEAGCLVPYKGLDNDPNFDTWLLHTELRVLAARIPCEHVLIVLDACYSGTFGGAKGKPDPPAGPDCTTKINNALSRKSRLYLSAGGKEKVPASSDFARRWRIALSSKGGEDGLLTFTELQLQLSEANPAPRWGDFTGHLGGGFVLVPKDGCGLVESTDRDGDGVPNNEDRCPDQYGSATNNGCPPGNTSNPLADNDYDGIPNTRDACPNEYGTAKANGCPDRDNDGVPDISDKCLAKAGEPHWQGCPDTDGDGLPDHEDQCPDAKGLSADYGCPPPDTDGDGVPDKVDKCPNEAGLAHLQGCPEEKPKDNLVLIRGGTFQMGSDDGGNDEKPVHSVTVSDFYLGKYEVTVAEFKTFIDATGYKTDADKGGSSHVYTDTWKEQQGVNWKHDTRGTLRPSNEYNHPVLHVSWNDAVAYCKWMSEKTGHPYRLPTEAEWEYAAGGGNGKRTKWAGTNTESELKRYANYDGNQDGYATTAPVGSLQANALGLYDMTGNVWEWCSDWYGSDYYKNSLSSNPTGPTSGSYRVLRGGSWDSYPRYCRVADRDYLSPGFRYSVIGFRLARTK